MGERYTEHFTDKNKDHSVFYNHGVEHHNGEDYELDVSILNSHIGDPMRRQVAEGVCIAELNPILNRKEEWSTGRIIKGSTRL